MIAASDGAAVVLDHRKQSFDRIFVSAWMASINRLVACMLSWRFNQLMIGNILAELQI